MIIIIPKFTYLIDIKDKSLNSHSFLYKITDKNTDLTRIFVRTNKDIKIEAIIRYDWISISRKLWKKSFCFLMKIWGWKQFSIVYLFVNFSGYFVTICCHLFEKGIMTEQFDTKRSRLIMGQSSLSSHNHALITWKQYMLYRAAKVDFWQTISPLW